MAHARGSTPRPCIALHQKGIHSTTKATMILRLAATNDINGNPRRAYLLFDEDGRPLAAWEEGYCGSDSVPGGLRQQAFNAPTITVGVRELKKWVSNLPSPKHYEAQYFGSPYQLQQALAEGRIS